MGDSHVHCSSCGIPLEQVPHDHGYNPPSIDPEHLAGASRGISNIGSNIGPSDDRLTKNLRRLHNMTTRKKPSFLQLIYAELVNSGEGQRIVADAAKLLSRVDDEVSIGGKRQGLLGTRDMNKPEAKRYRTRMYAAATLQVLNDEGQSNRAPQIGKSWEIAHHDLVWAVGFIKSNRPVIPDQRKSPVENRSADLNFWLSGIRDFLLEDFPADVANTVISSAEAILLDHGEPLTSDGKWFSGRFCNEPAKKAAFKSVVEAMPPNDLPREAAKNLFKKMPIRGLQHWMDRSGNLF